MTLIARPANHTRIPLLAGLTLALALASGCSVLDEMDDSAPLPEKRPGEIPATAFVMAQITGTDDQPSGWWSGCLHLHLKRPADDTEEDRPRHVTCTLEFGFPIKTENAGRISRKEAQEIAADVTNRAKARVKLKGRMSAKICGDLKKAVIRMSTDARKGTRIMSMCHTLGPVPEFNWP